MSNKGQNMKTIVLAGATLMVAACGERYVYPLETGVAPAPTNDDLHLVRGYRSDDDWCQLTGETPFTVNFLDHTADLVSCPTGSDAEQSLRYIYDTKQVAETGGYSVYSIPRS